MTVTIIVRPCGACAEAASADSGLIGDIFKLAIAQVVIERVTAVAGHVNVGASVVVVIGDRYPHAPAFANESSGLSDIAKLEAVLLMVQRDHGIPTLLISVHGGPVDGEDVEPAVAIAVDQPSAATHRFHDVTFIG